jgi:hypothetical protein
LPLDDLGRGAAGKIPAAELCDRCRGELAVSIGECAIDDFHFADDVR